MTNATPITRCSEYNSRIPRANAIIPVRKLKYRKILWPNKNEHFS